MKGLVLSLFPGIGLLDMAFEEEGFCVVRGPDLLWGGDIKRFHPPAGRFDGVIGGPPCQAFSPIGNVNRKRWGRDSVSPDLTSEFERILDEAGPTWWVMENSKHCPGTDRDSHCITVDSAALGMRQTRLRSFWSNLELRVAVPALIGPEAGTERAVSWKGSVDWRGSRKREAPRGLPECLELQGFPADMLDEVPFTKSAAMKAVGNGVPFPMGRAIAKAVIGATSSNELTRTES